MTQIARLTYCLDGWKAVTMAHSSTPLDPSRRPPLRSLEIVCVVARSGSLTAAAETLGMTHGSASRHLKAVETWLGLRLFDRHGRGLRITEEGQRFLNQIERGLETIERAGRPLALATRSRPGARERHTNLRAAMVAASRP
jgi:DNA-binding transcriptional LysR family regulator